VDRRFDASVRRGLAPLVGRQNELVALEAGLARALAGQTVWLGVRRCRRGQDPAHRGVPAPRVRPACQILRGYCESYLSAEPLQPFLQMLRALLDADEPEEPVAELQAARPRRASAPRRCWRCCWRWHGAGPSCW
jgi:hypothetical protein